MQFLVKDFSEYIQESVRIAKQKAREGYGLNPGNNINLICQKLIELEPTLSSYVECGVYQGNTFFSVAIFLEQKSIDCTLLGFDSFEGFPGKKIDQRDRPLFFNELLEKKLISNEHYQKALERTKNFCDESHLTKEYFLDIRRVFEIEKDFLNAHLIKGNFSETIQGVTQAIDVLFLDCDLYGSYWDCLNGLYQQVVSGGVIIFDEFYSLKYPGPRLAVNEFFKDKAGHFEKYITDEAFERWCFVKY